ncbi:hypothetical protein KEJ51_08995 [Candidatus Bathyarchaeota archaeon]|nr:hypothetical protein [Candidatus Bathyarchaeota archaeon]
MSLITTVKKRYSFNTSLASSSRLSVSTLIMQTWPKLLKVIRPRKFFPTHNIYDMPG